MQVAQNVTTLFLLQNLKQSLRYFLKVSRKTSLYDIDCYFTCQVVNVPDVCCWIRGSVEVPALLVSWVKEGVLFLMIRLLSCLVPALMAAPTADLRCCISDEVRSFRLQCWFESLKYSWSTNAVKNEQFIFGNEDGWKQKSVCAVWVQRLLNERIWSAVIFNDFLLVYWAVILKKPRIFPRGRIFKNVLKNFAYYFY